MTGRPYDNIRITIQRAQAGILPPKVIERRPKVKIGKAQPIPTVNVATSGSTIAQRLVAAPKPLEYQVTTTETTYREARTAQQSGTRWLARNGYGSLRLSYERRTDHYVWTLTVRDEQGGP